MRIHVFVAWLAFALVITFLPLGRMAGHQAFDGNGVFAIVKLLTGLWLPVLACFSVYWFSEGSEAPAKKALPTQGQAIGAYGLTALYALFCLGFIAMQLYLVEDKRDPITMVLLGDPLDKRLSDTVGWLQLLSPVLLGPIAYLTGKVPAIQNGSD